MERLLRGKIKKVKSGKMNKTGHFTRWRWPIKRLWKKVPARATLEGNGQ